MNFQKKINFPTFLTLTRMLLSIFILPILIVCFLPYNNFWINLVIVFIFSLLCLTDFFDGYLARKYKMVTKFGKALDQIADKFLIVSTLISLLAIQKINFFWVIILIMREIFVMGLRELALENDKSIPVSFYGKLKTTFQMLMLIIIISNPHKNFILTENLWNFFEKVSIYCTVFLSIFSAKQYYKSIFAK